jgi:cytidine deaminase
MEILPEELSKEQEAKLLQAAIEVRENAYAPYSRFKVGAAILADNGEIYTGCDVENASYGLSICAERAAVFHAVLHGCVSFRALAVVADLEEPVLPCGACRQILNEFSPSMWIIMGNLKGKTRRMRVQELLPHAFSPAVLPEGEKK